MDQRRATALRRAGLTAGLGLAVLLTLLVASVVYGVTEEYGAGAFGSLVVPIAVSLLPALVVLALWRTRPARRLAVLGGVVLLVAAVMGGASWAGERANRDRLERESATFSCDGFVDPRVDEAFARMPRPALVYGPVEASRTSCTAGVSGGPESYDAYRAALTGAGWRVVEADPDRTVLCRGGLVATLTLDGGVQTLLQVATDR
jgi:hypothetical protein